MTGWGLPIYPPPFKLAQTLPTPKPCQSTPSLIGSPSRHRGSGKNLGHGLWFGAHQHEVSDVSMMLNSPWSEGSERSNGCVWAFSLVGETVTKECHPGRRACRCDCPAHTANSNVSSNTWCPRKNLCVPRNWEFRHATRILDVIMLKYPLKVCPIPGIWV